MLGGDCSNSLHYGFKFQSWETKRRKEKICIPTEEKVWTYNSSY